MSLYSVPLSGHDAHSHLDWIEQFRFLRRHGINYPRWLPWSFGGFGSTAFYFYPPLTFWLGDAISLWTGAADPTRLYHLLQLSSVVLTFLGMVAYLRFNGIGRSAAVAAALIAALGPYHFWDIYVRCALPEQMAFAYAPFLLLSVDYALSDRATERLRSIVLAAMGWAAIILTNIPTTVIFLIAIPIYGIVRASSKHWRALLPAVVGALLGALLAAFYILPIVHFQPFIATEHLFDNYIPGLRWAFTIQDFFRPDIDKNAKHLLIPVTLGLSILLAIYFRHAANQANHPRIAKSWLVLTILAVGLQIPYLATPVWDYIAPLHLIQFSWRWCVILVFVPAIAYALMHAPGRPEKKTRKVYKLAITAFVILNAIWYIRYAYIVLTFPLPPPMVTQARTGVPEHLPRTAFFSDVAVTMHYGESHQFDPPIILEDAHNTTDSVWLIQDHLAIKDFATHLATPSRVSFHTYDWPTWKLYLDGLPLTTQPDVHGLLSAVVPSGDHKLQLRLERSSSENAGTAISLTAAAVLLLLCLYGARKELVT